MMKQLLINGEPTSTIFYNGGIYEIDHYTDEGKMVLRPATILGETREPRQPRDPFELVIFH